MNTQNDFLDEGLARPKDLFPASKTKRFTNMVIDMICFYLVLIVIGIGVAIYDENLLSFLDDINRLVERLITMILIGIYYSICEVMLGGKTVGKYITRTRVLTDIGERPEWKQYVLRSFSRVVPFEPFSFLGEQANGWHDKWTDTMVIDEKLSSW